MQKQEKQHLTSIAVLPFVNMSSDKNNEYFSDGITEEILNVLVQVDGLHVTARTSSFAFKGKDIDVRSIGAELSVGSILEGSVRRSGKRVRITAQLIDTSNGYHLWSEKYDRELNDIFAIQDEIALMIVENLKEKLTNTQAQEILPDPPTDDIAAYDYYLKGRFGLNKGSKDGAFDAIKYFDKAIDKDPHLVLAHTGLCATYIFLGGSGIITSEEALVKARKHANIANQIDDGIAESHLALAYISFWDGWSFKNTCMSVNNALELSPGSAEIHRVSSLCALAAEKPKQAFAEIHTSISLDPLSLKGWFQLGECYYRTGKYHKAIKQFDKTLKENPYYQEASILKAWSHYFINEVDTAIELFRNIPVAEGHSITFYGGLAIVYAKKGNIKEISHCLESLKKHKRKTTPFQADYCYALIYRTLGDTEKMYQYLERCLDNRLATLIFIKVDPVWTDFKQDKKFKLLVKKAFGDDPNDPLQKKYLKSGLKKDDAKIYLAKLKEFMQAEKPYLDNTLGLKDLAKFIDITTNQLSQLLNEQLNQNFYDFVNSYRIEKFKEMIKDPKNSGFTLLALAYECGFNSKTTFNTFFKKSTGKTPSQYFQENKK